MKRLEWSRRFEGGGETEYDACSAAQKWMVGDVSTAVNVFLPSTKYGHGCKRKTRKLLQFRFPSPTISELCHSDANQAEVVLIQVCDLTHKPEGGSVESIHFGFTLYNLRM